MRPLVHPGTSFGTAVLLCRWHSLPWSLHQDHTVHFGLLLQNVQQSAALLVTFVPRLGLWEYAVFGTGTPHCGGSGGDGGAGGAGGGGGDGDGGDGDGGDGGDGGSPAQCTAPSLALIFHVATVPDANVRTQNPGEASCAADSGGPSGL